MTNAEIIIVEDNPHDLEMILDAFCESEIKSRTLILRDGVEATDYFFRDAEEGAASNLCPPLLILLDLKLPKVNGMEVLRRLKSDEKTKCIPVVVFTSSNEARDKKESYRLGANSYLVKPLDADRFAQDIKYIINYWTTLNVNAY